MKRNDYIEGKRSDRMKVILNSRKTVRTWRWETNRRMSKCLLELYEMPNDTLTAIVTEMHTNEGCSVTNGAESLWNTIRKEFPKVDLMLETYDRKVFDQVFIKNNEATWARYE